MKTAVLISGRGSNLKAILEAEKEGKIGQASIELVISNNPEAKGLQYAKIFQKDKIIIDQSTFKNREEYDTELIKVLQDNDIELIVLAGFMRILSGMFVRNFEGRIINIHPSLLPAFPGLHAQKQALDYGVKVSGCTVHFVNETVDGGPIILQKCVEVKENDTEKSLATRILIEEHKLFPQAIKLLSTGKLQIIKNRKVKVKK